MTTMNGWIWAMGRARELTLPSGLGAGATSAAADAGEVEIGAQLFGAGAGSTRAQWLGRVTGANASGLTWSRPAAALGPGAALWTPQSALALNATSVLPLRSRIAPGVTTECDAAGGIYAVQTRKAETTLRWRLQGLTPDRERELLTWLRDATGWGLLPFTAIESSGAMTAVQSTGEPIARESQAGERLRLELELWVIEEGGYR
jgi:hypothetical protein